MTLCKILLSGSALCTIALVAAATGPQETGQAEPGKPVEAASPKITPEHTMLKKMVGTWTATVMTSMPGKAPTTSTATAEYKPIGDTWVESTFNGEMDGKPYIGHGVDGYDTFKNKFVSLWVDSWSTEMHVFEGTKDASSNATTLSGECHDPATGKVVRERLVTEMKDNDSMTLHMYMPGPDGKEVEGMKIEFKRRK